MPSVNRSSKYQKDTDNPAQKSAANGDIPSASTGVGSKASPKKFPDLKHDRTNFLIYSENTGSYEIADKLKIAQLIQNTGGRSSAGELQDQLFNLAVESYTDQPFHPGIKFDTNGDILHNLLNGVMRINKKDGSFLLEKHQAYWMFNGYFPFEYNPDAECSLFRDELVDKLTDVNDRNVLLKFGTYCLIPDCRFSVALFCYGETHTGKSTLVDSGLGGVFGEMKGSLKLDQICRSGRFGDTSFLPMLQGKLINVGTEVDVRELGNMDVFKQLISGEAIVARGVYERGGKVQTFAKMAFPFNEFPRMSGTSAEMYRIRLIYFGNQTKVEDRIWEREKEIKKEAAGIYNMLLAEMPEVLRMQIFPRGGQVSQTWERKLFEAIDVYDHFIKWSGAVFGEGFITTTREMDQAVGAFLRLKHHAMTVEAFKKGLNRRKSGLETIQRRVAGKPRSWNAKESVWKGIKLGARQCEMDMEGEEERSGGFEDL